jgi:Ca-activated chloride channel family protein
MKKQTYRWLLLVLVALAILPQTLRAQPEKEDDRTLSPYFFVKSDDPQVDQLPLKSTSVEVNVAGVIADIVVTQVYKNEGTRPLEAIYVFPASTRAAVYGMTMTIGERTITAKIRERAEARQEYEQAKQAGQSASLLEQQRPNVFQMNVANILPGDVIRVELKYTELLVPTDAVYELVYPTVVGPRYSNQAAAESTDSDRWIENPYLSEGELPSYTFDITVDLGAGLAIQEITCPSHRVNVSYDGPTLASVRLDPSENHGGNRDFILRYRLAGDQVETGLLLFEGDKENFFLLMAQPPYRVRSVQIPPREYLFIVDVSGSMHGFPLNISKKLLRDLLNILRPTDRFNVLLFAGGSSLMAEQSLPATPENLRQAITLIDRQRGGGGTELLPALRRALSLPKPAGYARTIVIATDGYVSVEAEAFDLIQANLDRANMFAFGIGSSVNRYLIEGMARVGQGEPFVVTEPEEAPREAARFRKLIASPVLTGITLDLDGFDVYDVEPLTIPDVMAQRPVVVFGKWRGKRRGTIRLRGMGADGPFTHEIHLAAVNPLVTNGALRYLWARHRIAILSDYNMLDPQDERIHEVTTLGLSYNLLTAYTSFVAIDSKIRAQGEPTVTVKQPLPLPQGVSNHAVAGHGVAGKACVAMTAASGVNKNNLAREEAPASAQTNWVADASRSTEASQPEGHITLRKIVVSPGLSKKSIRILLKKHLPSINQCYSQTLGHLPTIKGDVECHLLIDTEGRVIKVTIGNPWRRHKDLQRCIVNALKSLSFPMGRDAKRGFITITFVLA